MVFSRDMIEEKSSSLVRVESSTVDLVGAVIVSHDHFLYTSESLAKSTSVLVIFAMAKKGAASTEKKAGDSRKAGDGKKAGDKKGKQGKSTNATGEENQSKVRTNS